MTDTPRTFDDSEDFDQLSCSSEDEPIESVEKASTSTNKNAQKNKSKERKDKITPFLRYFTDPISCSEFREVVDAVTPEDLGYDRFDQKIIMERLIEDAHSQGISPQQLFKDIKFLISSDQMFKNFKQSSDVANEIDVLKKRYQVTEAATDSNSVTIFRLNVMFPQYSCKIADSLLIHRISSHMLRLFRPNSTGNEIFKYCFYCQSTLESDYLCLTCKKFRNVKTDIGFPDIMDLPACMKIISFSSAIPSAEVGVLKERERQILIVAHLVYQIYFTYYVKKRNAFVPEGFNIIQIIVMEQIKNGLLSDACRLRLLQNMGVVFKKGDLCPSILKAVAYFKTNCPVDYSEINWEILGFEEPEL